MTPKRNVPPIPKLRMAMLGTLAVAGVCMLIAVWLILVTTPGAQAEERAFKEATSCSSSRGDARGNARDGQAGNDDCLRTVPAVIDSLDKIEGRSPNFWLNITEADGTSTRTRLAGTPAHRTVAHPGAEIEVTYWRGQIRYVDFESVRRSTKADVRGDYRLPLTSGLGLGAFGVMIASSALVTLWTGRRSPRVYTWQTNLALTGGLCLTVAGAVAPWPTHDIGGALHLLGLSTLVVLAGCAVAAPILWWRNRGDDTIAMEPAVLTEKKVVTGAILGDVPYASNAYSVSSVSLIAAPGSLETALDPVSLFHHKKIPNTLTPLRLRPPYLTDPPGRPDYRGRAVVLECEDGGVPVLIVTEKKDMPVVLGALGPMPVPVPTGNGPQ
ncbi:hypothetical protein [Streptomyces sp. NPDC057552]|uniref:hypothetical protein n=1 Tax=Streptomyces sp. NPDC057552 TaxID=3350537 RepID=UPI0036C1989B